MHKKKMMPKGMGSGSMDKMGKKKPMMSGDPNMMTGPKKKNMGKDFKGAYGGKM